MASWITKYLILSSVVLLGNAVSIARNEFKNAVNYTPTQRTSSGLRNLTDNFLTISEGFVVFLSILPDEPLIYYDGYDSGLISMSLVDPVSAIGLEWISNNASVTLSVFNAQKVLLESLTLDWKLATLKGDPPSPSGFIGINYGSEAISYATIDTPLAPGNELFVGMWVYQSPDTTPNYASPKQSSSAKPVASPIPSPSCERCIQAYRTEECQLEEKSHPNYLSVDIMDCNYGDVDEIKGLYGCTQNVPGCDTWVCTEYIPDTVIQKLTSCPPVIVGSLYTAVNP